MASRRRWRSTAGWCSTSTSPLARCGGSGNCGRPLPPIKRHLKSSFASETPVTDGERVYVYFGTIGLVAALELHTGEVVWTQDVGAFNGGQEFGPAASPVLHDGRLYVVNDNTTESFLTAFDAETGEQVWRVVRGEPRTGRRRSSGRTVCGPSW